jgi:cobalt/nickel transport system permease protein
MTLAFTTVPTTDSPLSRLDPRWKLVGLGAAIAAAAVVRTPAAAGAALAGGALLAAAARLPGRWLAARLGELLLGLVPLVVLLPLTSGATGAVLAAVILLKGLAIGLTALVLMATAPLPTTLVAAQRLRVPGRLVQVALLTYRYVFVLAEELARLRTALRVRGFRARASGHTYRTVGQVTGTLLVRGTERAERVAQAMRCRGFDGRFRTLDDFRTTRADVLACVGMVVAAAGLVVGDWAIRASG